jgi:hypothetical protein
MARPANRTAGHRVCLYARHLSQVLFSLTNGCSDIRAARRHGDDAARRQLMARAILAFRPADNINNM